MFDIDQCTYHGLDESVELSGKARRLRSRSRKSICIYSSLLGCLQIIGLVCIDQRCKRNEQQHGAHLTVARSLEKGIVLSYR